MKLTKWWWCWLLAIAHFWSRLLPTLIYFSLIVYLCIHIYSFIKNRVLSYSRGECLGGNILSSLVCTHLYSFQDWYIRYWPSFVFSSHTHFAIIHRHFIHANLFIYLTCECLWTGIHLFQPLEFPLTSYVCEIYIVKMHLIQVKNQHLWIMTNPHVGQPPQLFERLFFVGGLNPQPYIILYNFMQSILKTINIETAL